MEEEWKTVRFSEFKKRKREKKDGQIRNQAKKKVNEQWARNLFAP